MERTERNEKDDAQKAKIIFLSLAAAVLILLIWSFASAGKVRTERDAVRQELESVSQDNLKLEQIVKDLSAENETLRKKVQQLEAKIKTKPAPKKKTTKPAAKKTTKTRRR